MNDKKLQIKDFEKNNYFATQELVDVVNAALFLDKPLLIEGPAGTGKTYLAKSLSNMLSKELIRLQCHEGIDEDLFTDEYLIERPILKSLKTSDSLFLVDEIDRSDEEFEALLLEVLAEKQVTIPEIGTVAGEGNNFTILTSNSTRDLSEALRRRCIYFFLDYPSIEIETKVILSNVESISQEKAKKYSLFSSFIRKLNLNKPPSLIETVEWVKYNHENNHEELDSNIGILIKDIDDQKLYREKLKENNDFKNGSVT
jgi:MoxR-like ATPase